MNDKKQNDIKNLKKNLPNTIKETNIIKKKIWEIK